MRTRGLSEVPGWGEGPADSKSFGLCWLPGHPGGRPRPNQAGGWPAGLGRGRPPPPEASGHRVCLGFWSFLGASPEPPMGRPHSLGLQTPRMVEGEAVGCWRKAGRPYLSSSCKRTVQREAVRVPGIPCLGSASVSLFLLCKLGTSDSFPDMTWWMELEIWAGVGTGSGQAPLTVGSGV